MLKIIFFGQYKRTGAVTFLKIDTSIEDTNTKMVCKASQFFGMKTERMVPKFRN